ncbi:unnamed protein product [Schistosoma bovis]|nr:unnamed protein product [Schistosoma bovis]
MQFFSTVCDRVSSFSSNIYETFYDLINKFTLFYSGVLISIREGILAEIFPSLLLSYNATVLLILTLFLLGLSTFLLLRHLKSHVPLRVKSTQVPRGFRRRDKIRYHAIRFGRKFSEITEELKKVQTKEERRTTIINFARKIFKLHDIEKSPTLAYGRLPESFFEPDEEDVSSLPEDLRLMISSIRVFGQLEKSFFIRFCKFIETIELNVGEYLFRIGDEDKYVYVIRSGRIQITVTEPDGSKCIIAEVGKGGSVDSLLSVLSILTGYPSTFEFMEAVALEPTTVLCLPARSFLEICKTQTPLFRIIQMIAVRLQRLSFNALHNYLGLSSELINKDFSPISGSSEAHEFLCKVFEKRPSMKDFNEFGNISLKYPDLDLTCSKVKFSISNVTDDQKSKNSESELEQVFTYNDDLNLDSMSQSGALELGESPIFYNRKTASPIFSPSQPPSPNCKHRSTNLRRARSLADTSRKLQLNYDDVNDVIKGIGNKNNKGEPCDFVKDVNFTKSELEEMIKFAEKDLANLLNLTDTSILHEHVSLTTVSSDFILSRECEMQLEMYYVIFGELRAFQSTNDGPNNNVITMFKCGPGKAVGLLGLITGEPNIYGVQATTKTIVAVLSRETFYSVVRQYPKALFSVTHIISSHLSPLFHQLDFAIEWLSVKSGKALYKKGEIANHVYVVLSGRLRQVDNMPDGGHRIVSELGRGDLVGFLEVISQQTRISTVMAIRDSELAQIPSHLLHHLKNKFPQVLTRIIQLLSDKLLGNLTTSSSTASQLGMPLLHMTSTNSLLTGGLGYTTGENSKLDVLYSPLNSGVMTNLRTIAVLPTTTDINAEAFTLELQHSMSSMGSSVRLTSDIVLKRLGSCAFDSVSQYRLSTWLSHQEDSHRIVFFVCDCQRVSAWNRICIRQADCILVLALHSSDPARPSPIEMALKNDPTKVAKVLILMYPLDTDYTESGKTAVWLNARPWISQHYHIRCEPRVFIPRSKLNLINFYTQVFAREKPNPLSDFSRLARYIVGEAVGLVLGGGGARGCSHVGLIRAFQEAGIPIDLVGGTSIGSFMGALWADETRVAQFTQRARNFTNCFNSIWKKIKDFTYPAVSIFSGKELNRQLQSTFHDRQIEDFWLPFFCVTTDITNCKMRIHTQGVNSSGSDKYHRTDGTNVQNFPQLPDIATKITITDIPTYTDPTVSSGSSITAVRKFPKSTHTVVSDSTSRYFDTDHCLQSGSSSKISSSNEQHRKEEQKHIFDFLKNNLSSKSRRRFLSDCYDSSLNVGSSYSYRNSDVLCNVNRAPILNNLIISGVHPNHLRKYKSDYGLQAYDNSQTGNLMMNSDLDPVVNASEKSAHVTKYSLSSFRSLEDDGYLEDDESSTDCAHSPVTASDPELRHDVYPESSNAEDRVLRQRSSSIYGLPHYLLHTEVSNKRCDSPNSDNNVKNPSIIKGQQGSDDANVFMNNPLLKLDMTSVRNRTKPNRKRHHRSSLDRLRTDRDRGAANSLVNLP